LGEVINKDVHSKHITAVRKHASPLREFKCHTRSHVLPVTRQRRHSHLYSSQLRLVLDLATPEGCKAELT